MPSRSTTRASSSWTRPATTRSRRPARWPAAPTSSCFTTGRGSAFGCKPAPSIKLATNTDDLPPHGEDMDINCGDILDGVTIEEKGQRDLRGGHRRRLGQAVQVGGARLRRQRVRALADRRGDVSRTAGRTVAAAVRRNSKLNVLAISGAQNGLKRAACRGCDFIYAGNSCRRDCHLIVISASRPRHAIL